MSKLSVTSTGKRSSNVSITPSKDASLIQLAKSGSLSEDGLHLPHVPPKLPTKVKLQSYEGKIFELDYNVAKMSQTIKSMVEDSENPTKEDTPIKLNTISSEVLAKIIEYAKFYHKLPPLPEDELSKEKRKKGEIRGFDLKFVQGLDRTLLFELIMASNFLYIRSLIDLLCKHAVRTFVSGKTVEEVRKTFNIKNDFTIAEEEQLRLENAWIEKESVGSSGSGGGGSESGAIAKVEKQA